MEYLDIYDENGKHLGKEERSIVHRDALWHKTVHCWLYDKEGNIYFQIRKDKEKLYTTASGHVQAGETVKEAFGREVKEEIGVDICYETATLVNVVPFKLDREDGFRDRAFANVYVCIYEGKEEDFHYDKEELLGLVRVNADETLELLKKGKGSIPGRVIKKDSKTEVEEQEIAFTDFLVNKGEDALSKYQSVLEKVISLSK